MMIVVLWTIVVGLATIGCYVASVVFKDAFKFLSFSIKVLLSLEPPDVNPSDRRKAEQWFVVHQGDAAKGAIPVMPDMVTYTLCCPAAENNQKQHASTVLDMFRKGIRQLLQENPVLRGRFYKSKTELLVKKPDLSSPVDPEEYLNVVDWSTNKNLSPPQQACSNERNMYEYLMRTGILLNPNDNDDDTIPTVNLRRLQKLPLFGLDLFLLPDGYFCYKFWVTHGLADASTYYYLLHAMNHFASIGSAWNDTKPSSTTTMRLHWDNPLLTTKSVFLETYDPNIVSGPPTAIGILKNLMVGAIYQRPFELCIIDPAKVRQQANELRIQINEQDKSSKDDKKKTLDDYLNAEDAILLSAIGQAHVRHELMSYHRSERGHTAGIQDGDCGNFITQVVLPPEVFRDPMAMLQCKGGDHLFQKQGLPKGPYMRGLKTSCSPWYKAIPPGCQWAPAGYKRMFHVPHPKLLPTGLDQAIVFSLNDQYDGIIHNFYKASMTTKSRAFLDSLCVLPR